MVMSDYWSDCGMIFYCDGEGYALDGEGNTVCLCNERDIGKVLCGELSVDRLKNDKQKEAMKIILKYREVSGYGKQAESFRPRGYIRSRFAGVVEYKQSDVKRIEVKKRVPVCKVKPE
jgi:hypothetical protein